MFDNQNSEVAQSAVSQPLNEVNPQTTINDPRQPENKPKNKSLIISIICLILFLFTGTAGAFYYYFNIYLTPEKILQTAFENLTKLESGTLTIETEFSTKQTSAPTPPSAISLNFLMNQDFKIKASAKTDFAKKSNFIQTGSEITIDIPAGTQIPLLGQITYSPNIGLVSVDPENLYVKIEGIPQLPFFDATKINNQWIKINFKDLQAQYGLKLQPADEKDPNKTTDFLKKFTAIYRQNSFFKLEKLKSETVNNASTYHYKMVLDKEVFKKFVNGLNELSKQEGLDKNLNLNINDQLKNLDEMLTKLDFSGEIWIAKKEKIIKKVTMDLTMKGEGYSSEVKNMMALTNYNKPVQISKPQSTITIQQLMEELMGASLNSSKTKADDAKTIADVKIMQTNLELYFGNKNKYPLPPVGGNRLGVDAVCLDDQSGLQKDLSKCGASPRILPMVNSQSAAEYHYYLCADNDYIIEFIIAQDTSTLKTGKNYANQEGMYPENNGAQFVVRDVCLDPDMDGLPNYLETKYGTNKNTPDTDGDSYLDGAEVTGGYNPNGSGKL